MPGDFTFFGTNNKTPERSTSTQYSPDVLKNKQDYLAAVKTLKEQAQNQTDLNEKYNTYKQINDLQYRYLTNVQEESLLYDDKIEDMINALGSAIEENEKQAFLRMIEEANEVFKAEYESIVAQQELEGSILKSSCEPCNEIYYKKDKLDNPDKTPISIGRLGDCGCDGGAEAGLGHNEYELGDSRAYSDLDYDKTYEKDSYLYDTDTGNRLGKHKRFIRKETDNQFKERNRHVNKAVMHTINEALEDCMSREHIKRREIRGINRDMLPDVIYKIIKTPTDYPAFKKTDHTGKLVGIEITHKEFKAAFRHTDLYEKKGLFGESRKIARLLENLDCQQLQRIVDLETGRAKGKNMYVEASNIQNIIRSGAIAGGQNPETNPQDIGNILEFIADFDNNGVINNKDVGSSITGYQFLENIKLAGDRERIGSKRQVVNGPQTSQYLKNLLRMAAAQTRNPAIEQIITDKITNAESTDKGWFTTKDLCETIAAAPEIKPFLLIQTQSMNEYKKERTPYEWKDIGGVNRDFSIFAGSGETPDVVEQYFAPEDIRDEFFNALPQTDRKALEHITQQDAVTINRAISTKLVKTMNILVNAIFLNFGPMTRQLQYMRGNGTVGVSKDIPLTPKEKADFAETFKEQFIKKSNLSIGLGARKGDTYEATLGIGYNLDRIARDYSDRYGVNAGVNLNPFSGDVFVGVGADAAWQLNKKQIQDLESSTSNIKRLYIEGGAIANATKAEFDGYLGVGLERDKLGAIAQKKLAYNAFMSNLLTIDNYGFATNGKKLSYDQLKSNIINNVYYARGGEKFYKNYQGLIDFSIDTFVSTLEEEGVLETLHNNTTLTNNEKNAIIRNLLGQSTDGFIAVFEQAELEKANARGLQLTKAGIRFSVKDLLKMRIGSAFLTARVSGYDTLYKDDAAKINRISKELDYGVGMQSIDMIDPATHKAKSLENITNDIETAFAIDQLNVYATPEGTIKFAHRGGGNVLDLLHLYYTPDVLENNNFHYDGAVLEVGKIGEIGIANTLQGYSRTSYLVLGTTQFRHAMEYKPNYNKRTGEVIDRPTIGDKNAFDNIDNSVEKTQQKIPTVKATIAREISSFDATVQTAILERFVDINGRAMLKLQASDTTNFPDTSTHNGSTYYPVPLTGRIHFQKQPDGSHNITYNNSVSTAIVLSYNETVKKQTEWKIINSTTVEISPDVRTDTTKILDMLKYPSNIAVKALRSLDEKHLDAYADFMAAASNIDDGGVIDNTEYEKAADLLMDLIGNNVYLQDVKKYLHTTEDFYGKVQVINKVKEIFFRDPRVNKYTLRTLIDRRGDVFKELPGPNGKPMPEDLAIYRDFFKVDRKYDIEKDSTIMPGLVGLSASYRKIAGKEKHRRMTRTAMGQTRIFSDLVQTIDNKDHQKQAHDWLIDNLEKTTPMGDMLQQSLEKTIGKAFGKNNITLSGNTDVLQLLEGKQIKLSIDNEDKLIKLDFEYVFYMLAECANESLGINFKNIHILEQKTDIETADYSTDIPVGSEEVYNLAAGKTIKNGDLDVRGTQADLTMQTQVNIPKDEFTPDRDPGEDKGGFTPDRDPGENKDGVDRDPGETKGGNEGGGDSGGSRDPGDGDTKGGGE